MMIKITSQFQATAEHLLSGECFMIGRSRDKGSMVTMYHSVFVYTNCVVSSDNLPYTYHHIVISKLISKKEK